VRTATTDATPEVAYGVLQRIDLIAREVTVRQETGPVTYTAPPDCQVLLNGERVKLRMLQPRDRVRVAYHPRVEGRTALSVEAATRAGRFPEGGPAC
jgi:hypothetical protein